MRRRYFDPYSSCRDYAEKQEGKRRPVAGLICTVDIVRRPTGLLLRALSNDVFRVRVSKHLVYVEVAISGSPKEEYS